MVFEFETIVAGILPYVPNIVFILIVFIAGHYLNMIINHSYRKIVQKLGRRYGIALSKTTLKIILNLILGVIIIVNIPGVNDSMLRLLGVVGAGIIAFSSSTIIANFMSGLIIKTSRMYRPGDVVKVHDYFGEVADVHFLYTLLETPKKELVTVPNAIVMSGHVTNYSRSNYLVNVGLTLGYEVNRLTAEKLLAKAAKDCDLKEIFVSVTKLGDFSVKYRVNGELTDPAEIPLIESTLRKAILDEFNLANIEIVSPTFRVVRASKGKAIPKGLSRAQLTKAHREALSKAKKIEKELYAEAERIRRMEERKILKGQFQ